MVFTFNIAKGRVLAFYEAVRTGTPSTSRLVLMVLIANGLEAEDDLKDHLDLASILASTNVEAVNTNYTRKVFVAGDLSAPVLDHALNELQLLLPNIEWTGNVSNDGEQWAQAVVGYVPDIGTPNDDTIIPLFTFPIGTTPNGTSGILIKTPANGIWAETDA